MARLAIMVFGRHVGGESALVDWKPRADKPMFDRPGVIRGLQVPPRAPKNNGYPIGYPLFFAPVGSADLDAQK